MEDNDLIQTGLNNVFSFLTRDGPKRLLTKALVPGAQGEKTINVKKEEFRIWDPYHSKLAALIIKGAKIPLKKDSTVLYLGAANGTTVSHVSDIVSEGTVFAVEFSPRAMKDLIRISTLRNNLIPILADARHPNSYRNMVTEVDMIYQDVAQREQAEIMNRNAELFLKNGGCLVLIIKIKSIDSVKNTDEVSHNEITKLGGLFKVMGKLNLNPFDSEHVAIIALKEV